MRLAPTSFLVMDSVSLELIVGEPLWLSLFEFLPTYGENKTFWQVSINSKRQHQPPYFYQCDSMITKLLLHILNSSPPLNHKHHNTIEEFPEAPFWNHHHNNSLTKEFFVARLQGKKRFSPWQAENKAGKPRYILNLRKQNQSFPIKWLWG